MTSFLHNLLHSSPGTPSTWTTSLKARQMHSIFSPPAAEDAGIFRRSAAVLSGGTSTAVAESSSNLNFSDPGGGFFSDDSVLNSFASAVDSDAITMKRRKFLAENDVDELGFGCEESEAPELPANAVPPRSSKRSRATEIHNLSEKRRRCRINEKLKALQNLIPNSNKTDKASMLDEAIEYLKQLQLQVQMLTMRNGLSLHPVYLPEALQSMQLPQREIGYDEGSRLLDANRGDTFCGSQEISIHAPTAFDISIHTAQNQPVVPPMTNISIPESSYNLENSIQNPYGLLTHLTPSKVTLL
ncbi:hypothetical protein RJ640_006971 [Escallonia rubra]|uniref:BHLH domain-containing protein n=1 Tax=Escallonia rubra TaxID=112253 RepID=A0AA88S3D6_9ASTE|nr:hypothetical protein RJ640_006971 [Escallonia rubra]